MKKMMFVLAFALFGTAGLMAQETAKKSCDKGAAATSCCAKKAAASTASVEMNGKVLSMAESAAASDETITKRVCAESGAVSFYQESKCPTSGKISYHQVTFDADSNQFVNVSPNDIGDANAGKMIKVSNVDDAAETTTKATEKKACAKDGKASGCCSKKPKTEK